MHILVIEDDLEAARYMVKGLKESGHVVDHAADGEDGLAMAFDGANRDGGDTYGADRDGTDRGGAGEDGGADGGVYDVLIVDRMLPSLDGLTLVERLRAGGDATPVLFLSALGDVDDKVRGLRAGGDDYLAKPYAFTELLARIEALARRRNPAEAETRLRVGDLEMDLLARTVTRAGHGIALQPREFLLLEYLMRHAGQVVTRTMLLENVWEYHFDPQTNVIDVHISRLRAKIDKGFARPLLHTVRGSGYCLRAG
jgi:two-component system OmpR family response regulator